MCSSGCSSAAGAWWKFPSGARRAATARAAFTASSTARASSRASWSSALVQLRRQLVAPDRNRARAERGRQRLRSFALPLVAAREGIAVEVGGGAIFPVQPVDAHRVGARGQRLGQLV